jgi:cobalt-zinc-cadmium efflux system membrane fusion protein
MKEQKNNSSQNSGNNSGNNNGIYNIAGILLIIVITVLLAAWLLLADKNSGQHGDEHGHEISEEAEFDRGPHGGRLLSNENFELEITIYESGLPPEFRVYAYHDKQALAADGVKLDIKLKRTGNKVDHIKFVAQQDYLRGKATIYEPHSFEVLVKASYENKTYSWQYESFEGRTQIPASIASEMGIQTEAVAALTLLERRTFTGRIQTNPNRLSHVRPRFAGVIKTIHFELGDMVRAGDIMATVQSNESLQNYSVKAAIDGMIVKRDLQVGEATGETPLFIIADHSDVWVELDIFLRDLALIKKGQTVLLETLDGKDQITAAIDWVSPLTAHASQSVRARVTVANKEGILRPGQFIRGHVTIAEHEVALAVRQSALQRFRDFQVVFARFDDTYEVRMLELGRSNNEWVEVLGGIDPGTQYVTKNSYLIKADIEKSGASHDH